MIPSSPDFPFDYRAGCVIRKKVQFHETWLPVSRRMVLVALIFLLALSFLPPPATAAANWYNISWPYRQNITINKAYVNGTGVIFTNFPVLVSITDTYLTSSQVQSNGNDILFTASDGVTKLSHEIENFTQGTGTLVAWVNVPSLPNSTNTTIYMYYGNLTVSNQQNATGVWDSNYNAVWHFAQNPAGTAPQELDIPPMPTLQQTGVEI